MLRDWISLRSERDDKYLVTVNLEVEPLLLDTYRFSSHITETQLISAKQSSLGTATVVHLDIVPVP